MAKRGKGNRKRKPWPRPKWFPAHWAYDPKLLPTREQQLAQIAEHERIDNP